MGAVMNYSVKIEGLGYCYPDGTQALQDINLAVEEGQKVALIGPCGAGKSTLLQAMAGFVRGSGSIEIDGLKLCSQNMRLIRSIMGCYMGHPEDYLSMPTVYEDIIFGPLSSNFDVQVVRQNVDFALQKLGLTALIKKASCCLSDGQKRSTAIATVLSMSPKIIMFDEPDGSLDPHNRNTLVRLLGELSQTLIIATCNMRFAAAVAQRAIVVDGGRIVADGPVKDILYNAHLMTSHGLETP
jgi:cobalt/nickel transport system ATP-binding protein